jgi:anti-sigma factor RsiW
VVPEPSHEHIAELLPWYVNSTLSPDEQSLVERHLASCHTCAGEVWALMHVGGAIAESAPAAPHPAASLARTMAALDQLERQRPANWLTALAAACWNPSARVARLALAAQLAVIAVLAVALTIDRPADQEFGTLSGGAAASAAGVRLTVMFAPAATEEAIRAALQDADADIVSGPSAAGVYIVRLRGLGGDDPSVDPLIQKLRSNASVVRFVERQP